MFKAVMKQKKQ